MKTLLLSFATLLTFAAHAAAPNAEEQVKPKALFEALTSATGDKCKKAECTITVDQAMCEEGGDKNSCSFTTEKGEAKKIEGAEAKKLMQALLANDVELFPDGAKLTFRSAQFVTCTHSKKSYTCKAKALKPKSPHGN